MELYFKEKVEIIHQIWHELKLKNNNLLIFAKTKEYKIIQVYK